MQQRFFSQYFEWRNVNSETYRHYRLPEYLRRRLPPEKHTLILDFGCGYGQILGALRDLGYKNLVGIDIEQTALEYCRGAGLAVIDNSMKGTLDSLQGKADFIVASHVIEHFPKAEIVAVLRVLRGLLSPDGTLVIAVPNAQSFTGCYWAYEDFTHEYLFTSGSLYFVLRAAGFTSVEFIDIDCLEGLSIWRKFLRQALLAVFRANYRFWGRVTASATHAPSPDIFSYEIKALAKIETQASASADRAQG